MAADEALHVVAGRQRLLWAAAVVLYGVGDTVTTFWGLSTGGVAEAGPVAAPFIDTYGRYALVGVKVVVFGVFFGVWRLLRGPGRAAVPAALIVVGAAVSLWNLTVIVGR